MKYLVILLFVISCSSQQNRITQNNKEEPIFTTEEWKALVVNELDQRLKSSTNSEREQSKILEDIAFIKSKDNDFLEKQFSTFSFQNKKINSEDSFYLINSFIRKEDHDEYTYVLENNDKCRSYLYRTDGFDHSTILKKIISKKGKKCDQKINDIIDLVNYSPQNQFFHRDALLIVWSFSKGKKQIRVIREIASSQDDLIEKIFYDAQ